MNHERTLIEHEIMMAYTEWIPLPDVIEELRLLADSMSTHKALAEKIGISDQFLCDILKGKRLPGKKVLKFLKLESVLMYREAK